MINLCIVKHRFKSTLFTILITLQISACAPEDLAEVIATDTATDKATDTNIVSDPIVDPDTDQVAMYSYNANLSDAQPLNGAVLEQTSVYMFVNNTSQYSSMSFYCCKGIDGASTGEAHKTPVRDSSAPFVHSVNLSEYSTTGTRELYVDATRTDGSGLDSIYVNFSINTRILTISPTPEPTPEPTANSAAIISGVNTASVTEDVDPDGDNLLEVGGKLNITDSDAGEAVFIAKIVNGNVGNLTINTAGNWNYAANNNQGLIQNLNTGATLTDNLVVSSADNTRHTIRITINGANEVNHAAVITGNASASVTEDVDPDGDNLLEVGGKLNITDSDAGEAVFIAKIVNGNVGNLTINTAGNWNYAANNSQSLIQNLNTGATLTDNLVVSSADNTRHTIRITINGANEVNHTAVITGNDNASVTEDVDPDGDNLLEVGGKLNITDNDAGEAVFIAKTVNGNIGSLTINTAGNWNYAASNNQSLIQNLNTGATLIDSLVVSSIDGTTHNVVIMINGADEANTTADISLSWVAPAEREDNSAISLSEIAGYKVSYGTTQGQYSSSVTINDGTAVGYTFKDFPADTYYFVVTTLDTEGRESQNSTEVIIEI